MSKIALVVDDSTVTRMMVKKILTDRNEGWEFLEADSADKAMTLIPTIQQLDLATIDQNMPGEKTGLDFAEELKKAFPKTKITMITANIQDAVRKRADAVGVLFIEKPVSVEKINNLLGNQ